MRRCRLLALLLLATSIACAGEPTGTPTPPVTTSASPTPIASVTPTPSPSASVTPPPSPVEEGALLPDGVLAARLGDPWSTVLRELQLALGPPVDQTTVRGVQLQGYFSDGPGVRGTLRTLTWPPLSLVFLDRSGATPVQRVPFVAWFVGWSEGDLPFTTPEGIGIGDTRGDLERAYGDALTIPTEMGGPCATSWVFFVETADGPYRGTFEEEPTRHSVRVASLGVGEEPSC